MPGSASLSTFAGAAPVREQAVSCLADHGKLVLVGLTDRPLTISNGTDFSFRQKQILGHYGSGGHAGGSSNWSTSHAGTVSTCPDRSATSSPSPTQPKPSSNCKPRGVIRSD